MDEATFTFHFTAEDTTCPHVGCDLRYTTIDKMPAPYQFVSDGEVGVDAVDVTLHCESHGEWTRRVRVTMNHALAR